MSDKTSALSELVNALDDGIAFYDEALRRISNPIYTDVFERMRALKTTIAADLNDEIISEAEQPPSDGTLLGSIRLNYADAVANLADHPRHSFVEQLVAQEERVLEAFRSASSSNPSARVQELATLYLPKVELMYDEISKLKAFSALQVNKL